MILRKPLGSTLQRFHGRCKTAPKSVRTPKTRFARSQHAWNIDKTVVVNRMIDTVKRAVLVTSQAQCRPRIGPRYAESRPDKSESRFARDLLVPADFQQAPLCGIQSNWQLVLHHLDQYKNTIFFTRGVPKVHPELCYCERS